MLKPALVERYKGMLRAFKEGEIRRIILRMLCERMLKESFVSHSVRGQVANISVYLAPGRQASALLEKKRILAITDGVRPPEETRVDFAP